MGVINQLITEGGTTLCGSTGDLKRCFGSEGTRYTARNDQEPRKDIYHPKKHVSDCLEFNGIYRV